MLTAAAREAVLDEASILYNVGMKRVVYFLLAVSSCLFWPRRWRFHFLIDPNQFRPLLETRLTQALGRDVKLGNLKLSILAGSVEADDLSIAEDPAFGKTPFLKASSLATQVELMPLIVSRQLNVNGIIDRSAGDHADPIGEGNLERFHPGRRRHAQINASPRRVFFKTRSGGSRAEDHQRQADVDRARPGHGSCPVYSIKWAIDITDFSPTAQFPFKFSAHMSGGGVLTLDGKVGPISEADAALTPAQLHYKLQGWGSGGIAFLRCLDGDSRTGRRGWRFELDRNRL